MHGEVTIASSNFMDNEYAVISTSGDPLDIFNCRFINTKTATIVLSNAGLVVLRNSSYVFFWGGGVKEVLFNDDVQVYAKRACIPVHSG